MGVSLPGFAPREGAKHPGYSSHCCSSGSDSGQAALGIFSVGPGGAQGGVQHGLVVKWSSGRGETEKSPHPGTHIPLTLEAGQQQSHLHASGEGGQ